MDIKLSACTIAKNEAENIRKSIESYKNYVDEIIIIDTGSIDETSEVAKKAGAKVLDFEWVNDFSAAKNYALDNATGDWIIFLDADEWFDEDCAKNIKEVIKNTINQGYFSIACKLVNYADETEIMEAGCTTRIFKKDENIRFERPIHEALFDMKKNEPIPGLYTPLLTVNHSGYMRKILQTKAKRNKILLDKTYALGKAAPIDYFYGLRENLQLNHELANYFFKVIENTDDYMNKISKYNVSSTVDENRIKLVNLLENEYSFEKRLEILTLAQKNEPENPIFKYYEYILFSEINRNRAIEALKEAVRLFTDFGKKYPDKINSFYSKAGVAFSILGEYEIVRNDKIKAMEYFVEAAKADYSNQEAFIGLISIIGKETDEDIIVFLSSVYDRNNKDTLKFVVDMLRLTKLHKVFLHFFIEYNKRFNEVDYSFFTSRILTEEFDEITDTYIKVFNESKDLSAMTFITAALIAGNNIEKYSKISGVILPKYAEIINAYFNDIKLDNVGKLGIDIFLDVFKEIAFISNSDILRKLANVFDSEKEQVYLAIIKYYFNHYSYDETIKWIELAKEKKIENHDFITYINYVLANAYFRIGELDKIEDCLDKAIQGGFLDANLIILCEVLEADDKKLKYYYRLYNDLMDVRKLMPLDNLIDISSDSIFLLNIDKFKSELKNKVVNLTFEEVKEFFEFAEKAFEKKAYAYAERYYRISLKFDYCVDKCYYALGYIYNKFSKPDLSFYCYEKAFCENLLLAQSLLPKGHKNYNYVFSKKEEVYNTKCPICGKEVRLFATYVNIDDEELDYNIPLIVEYMKCEDCQHIFSKNSNKHNDFWKENRKEDIDKTKIEDAYSIFEIVKMFSDKLRFFDISKSKEIKCVAENLGYLVEEGSKKADVIFCEDELGKSNNLEKSLKMINERLNDEGILVFKFFDIDNAFSKLSERPLWARANFRNIFSRKSISRLFSKYNIKVLKIDIDKVNLGKIVVYATK